MKFGFVFIVISFEVFIVFSSNVDKFSYNFPGLVGGVQPPIKTGLHCLVEAVTCDYGVVGVLKCGGISGGGGGILTLKVSEHPLDGSSKARRGGKEGRGRG